MSNKSRVLVVEDDADIRDSLTELLSEEGYQVRTADHGRDALDSLRANTGIDLILLDRIMPHMDGPSFLAERLRDPGILAIPVLLMSAQITGDVVLPNVAGVVRKPFDVDELLAQVRSALCI